MKDLAALVALYAEIDGHFETERILAINSADRTTVERIVGKQRINDQAYFVICWGQLETAIDEACRSAIRTRRAEPNWVDRRCWDLYNPDDKRLSGLAFDERAAIVLDKQAGPGSPWALVQKYYAFRNQIAHGDLRPDRIDVISVSADFYLIQAALTR